MVIGWSLAAIQDATLVVQTIYLSQTTDVLNPLFGASTKRARINLQDMREESSPVHPWNDFWERYYRSDVEVLRDGSVTLRTSKTAVEEEMIVNATINT